MNRPSPWDPYGQSIFTGMTELALRHQAVNLAQGFPDFDGPNPVKEAAIQAITDGRNQYAPSAGLLPLRQKIAERYQRDFNLSFDSAREVTIFSGATEALFCCGLAFLQEGDEVVTIEPFYDSYPALCSASRAKLRTIPLRERDWTLASGNWKQVINNRTRMVILNTPHNPSGRVFTTDDWNPLVEAIGDRDIIVVADEVYDELVFDHHRHQPVALHPALKERTVTISSAAKTFSLTGWKIGYVSAPQALTDQLRKVHQFAVFCSATPLQWGLIAAFELGDDYYQQLRRDYQDRRDLLLSILTRHRFRPFCPEGTYFILADYSQHSDASDVTFCQRLTAEIGVAAIPLSPFYLDHQRAEREGRTIRFAFCKDQETLREADRRLSGL